jgi:hypothetical protein
MARLGSERMVPTCRMGETEHRERRNRCSGIENVRNFLSLSLRTHSSLCRTWTRRTIIWPSLSCRLTLARNSASHPKQSLL